MIRIAVLGAGRIGRIHGRNAASRSGRSARWRPTRTLLRAGAGGGNGRRGCILEEIVERSMWTRSSSARRPTTHADLDRARRAAAGKAVFCEKPVDLDASRACLAHRREGRHAADDRLQPPLRSTTSHSLHTLAPPTARGARSKSSHILSRAIPARRR